uniref:Uncharacterized protein n=1 Tax=Arundo donax TaxID=35708 RepID=A0A0A8ZR82_ARUDO
MHIIKWHLLIFCISVFPPFLELLRMLSAIFEVLHWQFRVCLVAKYGLHPTSWLGGRTGEPYNS